MTGTILQHETSVRKTIFYLYWKQRLDEANATIQSFKLGRSFRVGTGFRRRSGLGFSKYFGQISG